MGTEIVIAVDVLHLELLAYQVSFCSKLTEIVLFIYFMCMTSSVILFAYFTHFSNLDIF